MKVFQQKLHLCHETLTNANGIEEKLSYNIAHELLDFSMYSDVLYFN